MTVTETLANTAPGTPATRVAERHYNVLGELVKSVDGAGGPASAPDRVVTTYAYDGSGLPDKVSVWNAPAERAVATADNSITTDFDHDAAGNRSRVEHPNLGTATFAYTALGELRRKTEGAYVTTYGYDLLGRLEKRDDPDGVAQWFYDPTNAVGALRSRCYEHGAAAAQCGDAPGFNETLEYDARSRLSKSTTTLHVGAMTRTYSHGHTYDTHGRPLTTTHPTGLVARAVYNGRGYLESLRDHAAPGGAAPLRKILAMNARGQVTREGYANGVTTARAFDRDSGRLERIDTVKGAATLQDNDYAWRSDGLLKSRVSHRGGASAKTETFAYDALGRLNSAVSAISGHASGRALSMAYDRLGNLKAKTSSVAGDIGAEGYAYGTGAVGAPSPTTLTGVTVGGVAHALTHDAWGRVTLQDRAGTSREDRHIVWNARHLPVSVTVGDSPADAAPKARDEFLYGPDGRRYYRKSTWEVPGAGPANPPSSAVEHTFYAGSHREAVRVGDTVNASTATSAVGAAVLHVRTTPVMGMPSTAFEYLHRDHLGSVESVSGADGAELKALAYDPFGSRRAPDWTRALTGAERAALAGEAPRRTARGYTGHEHLERTGLIHMNGRVHDPAVGRFLSPDPVVADASSGQSWNAYAYALNSPLSFSDPGGLTPVAGCPPNLCAGGGTGGGGFGPGSVIADSWHTTITVGVVWGFGFGAGLGFGSGPGSPGIPGPSTILHVRDPAGAGGARGGAGLEGGSGFRIGFPGMAPRPFVAVTWHRLRAWVGIGEEQSPADLPLEELGSAGLDIAQAVIGIAGLVPVLGNAADGVNAGISVARGDYQEAILDGASAVPGAGHGTGAVMAGIRGKRAVSTIWKVVTRGYSREGDTVYRVYGGKAGPYGRSWTRTDPKSVKDFRDAAGLPRVNSGRFVIEGKLISKSGVKERIASPLDGNTGGLDELVIPDAKYQIEIQRVYGVNPEY